MKHFALILIFFFAACILSNIRGCKPSTNNPCDTIVVCKTDTIIKTDTIVKHYPEPYIVRVTDTLHVTDTILLREQKTYKDSNYTAWVSGYDPMLDSIEVYPKTITIKEETIKEINVRPRKKPFGIGVQVGYGYPHGGYVGIGISYNLINF